MDGTLKVVGEITARPSWEGVRRQRRDTKLSGGTAPQLADFASNGLRQKKLGGDLRCCPSRDQYQLFFDSRGHGRGPAKGKKTKCNIKIEKTKHVIRGGTTGRLRLAAAR
ncbi:hypothetical protein E2C01_049920 [Portunus trituberculatus]|uniref:Uncharacterized protein n=1 Tax=Portunus trituberculatus TaxID=210409 RepID=A0A5B7GAQ8_PORTR|nr:hypothetical protein [Portunus trituberculatus]